MHNGAIVKEFLLGRLLLNLLALQMDFTDLVFDAH